MQQSNPSTANPAEQPVNPIRVCKRALKSQIVDDYKQGLSLRKVGTRVHIDVNFVSAVITEAGLMRANGEARRGRPSRKPNSVDKWKIVEVRGIARKSTKEIAKELHRGKTSIFRALQTMGWPVKACHSFGEVFDRAALRRLKEMSDLTVPQLAQELGMPRPTLAPQVSSTRIPGQELDFDTARKIAQWRESLFFRLMSNAPANPTSGDKFGQSSIVLAFFPKLRDRYSFLREVLDRLAEPLREHRDWSRHELEQYLCAQAMLEEAEEKAGRREGNLFRRFLPWGPALMPFLAEKLQDLRGVHHGPLALDILARSLGTTAAIISNVMYPSQAKQIRPISRDQMSVLILRRDGAERVVAQQEQPQPEAPKGGNTGGRGRRTGSLKTATKLRITLAVLYELQKISQYAMAVKLWSCKTAKDSADARQNTYKLFDRNPEKFAEERERLTSLSIAERERELKATEEKPRQPATRFPHASNVA